MRYLFYAVLSVGVASTLCNCASKGHGDSSEADSTDTLSYEEQQEEIETIKEELQQQMTFGLKFSRSYTHLEDSVLTSDIEKGKEEPGLGYDAWTESADVDIDNGYSETINHITSISDSMATAHLTIVNHNDTIHKTIYLLREGDRWVIDNMSLQNGQTTVKDLYKHWGKQPIERPEDPYNIHPEDAAGDDALPGEDREGDRHSEEEKLSSESRQ